MSKNTIKVVELFAGVGGFRIGLEGASDAYETIWNNQWEPSTKHQDASLVYRARFGSKGHSNQDINTVPTADIPDHDLLVGGFPCQDYSVASTLSRSGGIEGKKGVLWWQIYRILNEKGDNRHTLHPDVTDARRAFLMGNALVCGIVQQIGKSLYRFIYEKEPVSTHPIDIKRDSQPKLNFGLFSELNPELKINKPKKSYTLDMNKSLLVGFVKEDNTDYFLDGGQTKIYYTGKTKSFPSTVALNKLYYFMPYIKGKGVKDLYLIRIARIGCKAEIHPESNDKDPRLVFELEYLESLPNYMMLKPNIFNTYRNTVLGRVMGEIE